MRDFWSKAYIENSAGEFSVGHWIAESVGEEVTRLIEPPFLPAVKIKQMQIDCDGFEFLGRPRWAEFVFRNDSWKWFGL